MESVNCKNAEKMSSIVILFDNICWLMDSTHCHTASVGVLSILGSVQLTFSMGSNYTPDCLDCPWDPVSLFEK